METKELIEAGKTAIGIEFGSTRIKAVLVDDAGKVLAQGGYGWENQYENGVWTYSLDMIWTGLQTAYTELREDVKKQYGTDLKTVGAIGFSAMMHGYMAFDKDDNLLVPFRTWRNTITEEAAAALTKEFGFNIPQRWSIAHLYQAILNKEEHVKDITFFTTLAGYIHWQLTGEKVLGVGDASGMFPIDSTTRNYNSEYMAKFDKLIEGEGFGWKLGDIIPGVLVAGESAGTSIFAMVVMEKALSKVHEEIDVVTTPSGDDVAMVHCNNCTSDINAWANIFREYSEAMGIEVDTNKLYTTLFKAALAGAPDCGGLAGFNYFSGEPVTGFDEGRPVFARKVNADFSFANFMRFNLYSAVSTLKVGLDILLKEEQVKVDKLFGHGGFFKTPEVGQKIMSAATGGPVTVMETAGEGGAWGIAVLALFLMKKEGRSLSEFLNEVIFAGEEGVEITASQEEIDGFDSFMKTFNATLPIEKAAVETL